MSQTKEIRKYTRGQDEIDLDAWLNAASSGWDTFEKGLIGRSYLNSEGKRVKITEKDIPELRKSYNSLFKRFNSGDGSLTYNYDTAERGFRDSTGALNSDKNIYDGIVATHFGNTLRNMSIYKEPETVPLVAPVEYGDNALGTIFRNRLLGKSGTIRSFVDKDPYKDNNRGNTVRSGLSRDVVSAMIKDLNSGTGEFSKWNDEQKNKALSDLNSIFTVFDSGNEVTDDEYLDLEKILGLSDLRKMYAVGSSTSPTVEGSDDTTVRPERTYASKLRDIQNEWIPFKGTLIPSLTLSDAWKEEAKNISPDILQKLNSLLKTASPQQLTAMLREVIKSNDYRNYSFIKNLQIQSPNRFYLGGLNIFRNFFASKLIEKLKTVSATHDAGLHNFGETNPGAYYIGGSYLGKHRNTGFVYDSNNNTISEMSIYDIPYWRDYMSNWLNSRSGSESIDDIDPTVLQAFPRLAKGGTIKKYAEGGSADYNTVAKYDTTRGRYMYDPVAKKWIVRNLRSVNTNVPENLQYNPEGDVTDMEASDPLYNQFFKQRLLNDEALAKQWANDFIANHDDEKIKNYWKSQWYDNPNDLNTFNYNAFKTKTGFNGKLLWEDGLGGVGHDIYAKSVWIDPEGLYHSEILDGYVPDGDWQFDENKLLYSRKMRKPSSPAEDAVTARKATVASTQNPEAKTKGQLFGEDGSEEDGSDVDEVGTDKKQPSNAGQKILNAVSDVAPDLLSAARLYASLRANNNVAKTVRPSLKPVLKGTYERYSPVTGAFSQMQYLENKGNEIMRQAAQPFTSDASLAAARILEGQRQANELSIRGFLADDKEIKRTQAEALARVEDNMARRSQVANLNKESLNRTDRERAQLEASRLKANWRSWDNFLGGVESRLRERYNENRQDILAYQQQQDELSNNQVYQDELDQISNLVSKWTANHPGESITSASWYPQVSARQQEIARRLSNDNIVSKGKRRGYSYIDLYKDNPYTAQDWSSIIV